MVNRQTILCVEDNDDARELLQFLLEGEGFDVTACATSEEGLKLAETNRFSAIILDHRLENISGFEICRRIRAFDQMTPIIFYSGSAFPRDREEGFAAGGNAYLVKPLDFSNICKTIKGLTFERQGPNTTNNSTV